MKKASASPTTDIHNFCCVLTSATGAGGGAGCTALGAADNFGGGGGASALHFGEELDRDLVAVDQDLEILGRQTDDVIAALLSLGCTSIEAKKAAADSGRLKSNRWRWLASATMTSPGVTSILTA